MALLLLLLSVVIGRSSFSRPAAFYLQDNLVDSRLLELRADGSYRQIDVDRTSSVEADRGQWERDSRGAVLLHPTFAGLRFRALRSGPLNVGLDGPGALACLPETVASMRRFLAANDDAVFVRGGIAEMTSGAPAPGVLSIDANTETFGREELLSLARQIDDLLWSVHTDTYILSPVPDTFPELLVLQDAQFQAGDVARVRAAYRVGPGQAPPFYFAQVDARTFARRAGRWKVLPLLGPGD